MDLFSWPAALQPRVSDELLGRPQAWATFPPPAALPRPLPLPGCIPSWLSPLFTVRMWP